MGQDEDDDEFVKCGHLSIGMSISGPEDETPGEVQVLIMIGEDEGETTHIVAMDVHSAMAFAVAYGNLVSRAHDTYHDIEEMSYEDRVKFVEDKVAQAHGDLN